LSISLWCQKEPCQAQWDRFGASATFPRLVAAEVFPVSVTKTCSERTFYNSQFTSAKNVTAKATRALTEVLKNGFQECFQELYKHWQKCVTARENCFEGNVV
jgi:hypothetical protein